MKKLIYFLVIAFTLSITGCNEQPEQEKKLADLEKFRREKEELEARIKVLEKELSDTLAASGKKVMLVEAMPVAKDTFAHFLEVHGIVEADKNIQIVPELNGLIREIKISEGQQVSQGQVIAVLDNELIRKNISEVETSLELASALFSKQKNLWDQKIGSEVQYLEAKSRKESMERSLATLRAQYEKTFIRTPVNGSVDEVFGKVGEMASPALPLARIVNVEKVTVTANVSEAYLEKFKKGDRVRLYFPSIEKEFSAAITAIGQFINPNNRTFKIFIEVNNKEGILKPNLLAMVRVRDYMNPSALAVPSKVIQFDNKGNYLFIAEEKEEGLVAVKTYVETGNNYKGKTEITSGLSERQVVITEGYRGLTSGDLIRLAEYTSMK